MANLLVYSSLIVANLAELARVHPYELAYFSRVSGGLKAARLSGHPDAGDYWAAGYRRGVRWINQNLPTGSVVAVPFAEHLVGLTRGSRNGLRGDLELLHVTGPFELEAGKAYDAAYRRALARGPVYVMFTPRRSWENTITRHARSAGRLVFAESLDGEPVLALYEVGDR